MKRLAAAIIPLAITAGLILPSAWAGRCDLVKLKAYKPESKLVLPAKEGYKDKDESLGELPKAGGVDAAVFRYIVFNGVGSAVFNEYVRSAQDNKVEETCKSFDGLDAAKAKLDAKVDEFNKAVERFGKSSEQNVSATEKLELLGKIIARDQGKVAPKPLETDLAKTQGQPALKGGKLFEELDALYWGIGDHALLINLVEAQKGWQSDGAGLFVPGSMKALKDVLMGADAATKVGAVDSPMGLDLFTKWEDSRGALNKFLGQFGTPAKLEETFKVIEKAKSEEDKLNQDAAGRREKINQAGLPATLSGQLDTELLSRVFDNMKARGELGEYETFDKWKSAKPQDADAALKALKQKAGFIDAEGKPVQGAGFEVGQNGNEILFNPKDPKLKGKIDVAFANGDVDKKKDYSADIAAIADKILQRSPGAAKIAALRTAVQQASQNPEQLAKDIAMRGGAFGPLGIAPEAYSKEELASKRQAAMDNIAGQYSSLRQGARTKYDTEVNGINAKYAAAEQQCLAQARGATQAEVQAAYNACLKPHMETRDKALGEARTKLKSEIASIGTQEDVDGKLLQSEARQIAATDYLWSQELSKSVIKARNAIDKKVASDGYLTAADVTTFWDARWSDKAGDEYTKRMADLKEKVKKLSLQGVEGTVTGTVLKEFNAWWAPIRAQRVSFQQGIQRPTANNGGDAVLSDIDREIMEERRKTK